MKATMKSPLPERVDAGAATGEFVRKPQGRVIAELQKIPGVISASRLEHPAPLTVPSGIAEIDSLTGGLPRGALTEIFGPPSSGRTTLLLAAIAEATHRQEICALVDASDAFDPHSAADAGVDLDRLLWVRCSDIRKKKPGARNAEHCLEQALKVTDLLLQSGGFGMVVIDLGDIAPNAARRVPLTSWFRFRRAVENTPAVLLVVGQESYAKTCASLGLGLQPSASYRQSAETQGSGKTPSHAQLLRGTRVSVEVLRSRFDAMRKPAQSTNAVFESKTAWAG